MSIDRKNLWVWPALPLGVAAIAPGLTRIVGAPQSWLALFAWLAAAGVASGGLVWMYWPPSERGRDLARSKRPETGPLDSEGYASRMDSLGQRRQQRGWPADAAWAAEARALGILQSLPEPVIAIDAGGKLLLANSCSEELLGIDQRAVGERAVSDCIKSERLLAALEEASRCQTPMTRTDEIEWEAPGRGLRWFNVTTRSMVRGRAGAVEGAVAVFRDVSSRKASQRQNAEFVSAASHEMKTPLAGIKAYVELLADGDAEDEATREEFLGVINGQTDRLQRLIDNLLSIARIEAGVVQVGKRRHALNEILAEALRVVQPAADAKGIRFVRDFSPLNPNVAVDREMLLQAAINLLSNAVQYTPETGQVALRSRLLEAEPLFEVEDTGVGLSEEDCARVFDKFYRVEEDKPMAQGAGLGLPLAKYIVEDVHDGRISVTSKPGEGCIFQIRLPGAGRYE